MGHVVGRRAAATHRRRSRPGPGTVRRRPRTSTAVLAPGHDGHRLAGADGRRAARLPRRRGEDGPHVPGRSTACATRCPATGPACAGRRHHRAARPRLGHDQLRRREDLRRGGRAGASRTTPTSYDVVVVRPAERALGPGGRRRRAAAAEGARRRPRRPCSPRRRSTSPATSCPKAFVFVDEVVRSPAGKADYRWAKETVLAQLGEG